MYKHTQFNWFLLISLGLAITLVAGMGIFYRAFTTLYVIAILAFFEVFFSSLTVIVDQNTLQLSYGIGLFRKKINLSEVSTCDEVKNPWWYGYGVRKIPNGWMFNISGPHALELIMLNDRVYRIGTDEPEKLAEVIHNMLSHIRLIRHTTTNAFEPER